MTYLDQLTAQRTRLKAELAGELTPDARITAEQHLAGVDAEIEKVKASTPPAKKPDPK